MTTLSVKWILIFKGLVLTFGLTRLNEVNDLLSRMRNAQNCTKRTSFADEHERITRRLITNFCCTKARQKFSSNDLVLI